MPSEIVLRYCSPTLVGIKTGSLFTYQYKDDEKLKHEIDFWNSLLNSKGIYFIILRVKKDRALIYVYRKKYLEIELNNDNVKKFLAQNGYITNDIEECIQLLSKKLNIQNEFPHEIGVFLGYPINDIKAFIKNKGSNYKCIGCWKVYTNEIKAKKIFKQYKRCTEMCCKKYAHGYDIMRLTKAV